MFRKGINNESDTQAFSFLFVYFLTFKISYFYNKSLTTSWHAISYSMLTALLGTKGLLLLNIVYVCMTPTWSLLPI